MTGRPDRTAAGGQGRREWRGKEIVEVQPIVLGTNNAHKTNTSEEEGNEMGQHGTKRLHMGQTTDHWFPV